MDKDNLLSTGSVIPLIRAPSPKMRKRMLEKAFADLLTRHDMNPTDEPYLLFGALMQEILTLESNHAALKARVEQLETDNA